MAGILTIEQYKAMVPECDISDPLLKKYLAAMQSIAEAISSLSFGTEVTGIQSLGGTLYKLTCGVPLGEPGQLVRLMGGNAAEQPYEIKDCDELSITVDSPIALSGVTRGLPVIEHVGQLNSGKLYVHVKPIFSVLSVKTRPSVGTLWSDSSVRTLSSEDYEVERDRRRIKNVVHLSDAAIPRVQETGPFLIKRMARAEGRCVKVTYAAGFYAAIPADLQTAAVQITTSIAEAVEGGALASENIDYYSYTNVTADMLSVTPQAAIAILRRYAGF